MLKDPSQLSLYDDAGVACDRLGKPTEAIEWIQKKKAQLDLQQGSADWKEQEYRYLANLGTFYAHRWLQGWKKERTTPVDDFQTGEAFIAEAIEKNP